MDVQKERAILVLYGHTLDRVEDVVKVLKEKDFHLVLKEDMHLTADEATYLISEVANPGGEMYSTKEANVPIDESGSVKSTLKDSASVNSNNAPSEVASAKSSDTARGSSVPEKAIDDVPVEVKALSSGTTILFIVEKSKAMNELSELVGPDDPSQWKASSCLRSQLASEDTVSGIWCPSALDAIGNVISYLSDRTDRARKALQKAQRRRDQDKVDVEQLLQFVFPPHLQHPPSAGRLFVFAMYGPLDRKARLRSGTRGQHYVTDLELFTMSKKMEKEDILQVYGMCSLSEEQEEEVLSQVSIMLKKYPQYTKRDIEHLLAPLKRDADGCISFHEAQQVIMKERCRRVLCMKERLHPRLAPSILNKYRYTLTRVGKEKPAIAPSSMYLKEIGCTGAENATLITRLLSTYAFQICLPEDGNSPALTQNVRLVRSDYRPPNDPRPTWASH